MGLGVLFCKSPAMQLPMYGWIPWDILLRHYLEFPAQRLKQWKIQMKSEI